MIIDQYSNRWMHRCSLSDIALQDNTRSSSLAVGKSSSLALLESISEGVTCGFIWHFRGIFIIGTYMVITWKIKVLVWCFFLTVCRIT